MNKGGEKTALAVEAARAQGVIHPPCPVIPCRVASPQSPTLFHRAQESIP